MRVAVLKQGLPIHQFHREVRLAPARRVGRPGVIDLPDTGVLQPAERQRLILEAAKHFAGGVPGADHFQSHGAPRRRLLRLVHHAHPALTEFREFRWRKHAAHHVGLTEHRREEIHAARFVGDGAFLSSR